MIIRIVKMEFCKEYTDVFIQLFEERKLQIRSFPGCTGLFLLRDVNNPNIFFTYSKWDSADALEQYRKSELFNDTWSKVKPMFGGKPAAWSVYDTGLVS